MISNVKPLEFRPFLANDNSFSAFTSDGKSKYFILYVAENHYRVYGIDGINDGGTEFKLSLDMV